MIYACILLFKLEENIAKIKIPLKTHEEKIPSKNLNTLYGKMSRGKISFRKQY